MARLRMDRAQLALLSCRSGMLPILLHAACDASRIVHCISASAARRVVCCLPKRHVPMPLFAARARDETREHHSVAPGRTLLPLTAATTPEYQVRSDPQ